MYSDPPSSRKKKILLFKSKKLPFYCLDDELTTPTTPRKKFEKNFWCQKLAKKILQKFH